MTRGVYEVHEGTEGLVRLKTAWESLEATGADHVFQTYAHAELWQRTIGAPTRATPRIVTLREGERTVGIFPACRVHQYGVPLLTWIGAPRVLDYGDVLFDTTAAETPVDDFVAHSLGLLAETGRGALTYLPNVREDARAAGALGVRMRVFRETTAPFVPIVGTWEEYLARRGRDLRKDLTRPRRRLEERGLVEFDLLGPGDPGVESALEALVSFQRARFDGLINRTNLFDERYVRFRREQVSGPYGRIATLRLDGVPIAAALGVVYRNRYYSIVPGFDRAFAPFSPGVLLKGFVVRSCFENGWDPCDFCWGDEPHKYRWTDTETKLTTFVSNDWKGAALGAAATARHRAIAAMDGIRRGRTEPPDRA
jgi:CelD/BcsL family acetyltransferase involved in cellulose biosynthesis